MITNSTYVLHLSHEQAQQWISRLTQQIEINKNELNNLMPKFRETEKDYLEYKKLYDEEKNKVQRLEELIKLDKEAQGDLI